MAAHYSQENSFSLWAPANSYIVVNHNWLLLKHEVSTYFLITPAAIFRKEILRCAQAIRNLKLLRVIGEHGNVLYEICTFLFPALHPFKFQHVAFQELCSVTYIVHVAKNRWNDPHYMFISTLVRNLLQLLIRLL